MQSTKTLDTLIDDIYSLVLSGVDSSCNVERICDEFGNSMAALLKERVCNRWGKHREPTLRMSGIGKDDVPLWYEMNGYEPEPLPPQAFIKFLYGDIIEEVLLTLCELAGHTVSDRQKEVELEGVKGHIDATIDGELVDVKSASTYSFQKFQDGTLKDNDPFGYMYQMAGYSQGLGKDKGYFLAMDKTLGHLTLLKVEDLPDASERIRHIKEMIAKDTPPPLNSSTKTEASGNVYLVPPTSYCSYKHHYHPEIRTFLYASGPRHFIHIEKEPRVFEAVTDG